MSRLKVKNRNLFVTGGAGFIGSDFVRLAHSEQDTFDRIYILDKLTYAGDLNRLGEILDDRRVEFIEGDLNETFKYEIALRESQYAVNFAAETHVDRSIASGHPFVDSNIRGAFNFFEACRAIPNLRLVHISTDEVYGSLKDGAASETGQLFPASPYSASKAAADLLALANYVTHKQQILISRCSNNYGPHQHFEKFLPTVINAILENKVIPIYGNGMNVREWIFVRDHNLAILSILLNGIEGQIYNIGSDNRLTNIEMAKLVLDYFGKDYSSLIFVADRLGHDYRYALDWSKISMELSWKPKTEFSAGLSETINWYMAQTLKKKSGEV